LNEDFQRSGMAVMLENQARQLINENSATGGSAGSGTATNAGSEEWSGVALPLVRRIFGEIAAQDFVSVQPMNLPSGLVFYLDFKYGTTAGGFGNSQSKFTGGTVESIQGKTGPNNPSGSTAPFGVGGLYGEGKYDYSMNETVTELTQHATTANATQFTTGSAVTYKDINFNQEFSASLGNMVKLTFDAVSNNAKFDGRAVRAVQVTSGSDNLVAHLPQFSTFDESTGKVTLIVSASAMADLTSSIKVSLPTQPTESDRGDFEDTAGDATN